MGFEENFLGQAFFSLSSLSLQRLSLHTPTAFSPSTPAKLRDTSAAPTRRQLRRDCSAPLFLFPSPSFFFSVSNSRRGPPATIGQQQQPATTHDSNRSGRQQPARAISDSGELPAKQQCNSSATVCRRRPTRSGQKIAQRSPKSSIFTDQSCLGLRRRTRENSGKRVTGSHNLRVGSWNIGSLTGKSIELVKILKKRKINIACIPETRWVGSKARVVDGFKLWYSGGSRDSNGVGILVDGDLREQVVEVRRINDRLMTIKLVIGGCTLSVISAYAPQVGLDEEAKKLFYEDLDELVRGIPNTERIVIGGDFNGHIGATFSGFDDVHGGFGFGERNGGGTSLLDFAKAFELVIANSCFPKKENHLVTFRSSIAKTQIDYLLLRKGDRGCCKDCKVIPSENLTTQHKLLVMDLEIKRDRRKKRVFDRPRIKWGGLTPALSREMGEKLTGMGAWSGSEDADTMWNKAASCIREVASKVLGVSRCNFGGHKEIGGGMGKSKAKWKQRRRLTQSWWSA
ncbi:hypothetical protein KY285_029529 [Solanum tuberosum]|nr:hypothetical protein KY285_029529 [Solanum tuberosum]